MKCPYCAEEIADAAMVCKHCGRDFLFIRPLLEKIQTLESDLTSLRGAFLSFSQQPAPPSVSSTFHARKDALLVSTIIVILSCLVSRLVSILFDLISPALYGSYPNSTEAQAAHFLLWNASFAVGGSVAGSYLRRYPLSRLLFAASLVIPIAIATRIAFIFLLSKNYSFAISFLASPHTLLLLPTQSMFQSLMFFSFGWSGRWWSNRHQLAGSPQILPIAVAVARLGSGPDDTDLAKRVEAWTKILSVVAPILTVVATVITGYWSYLAALAVSGKN